MTTTTLRHALATCLLVSPSLGQSATPPYQEAYVKASNTEEGDRFGCALDVDGDTMVVSARKEDSASTGVGGDQSDNSAMDSGAAYVMLRENGTWVQQAYLKASNTDPGDQFGFSAAISGDTIVIGVPNEESAATSIDGDQTDDSAPLAGAAYVFVRSGSAWVQQAYLKSFNGEASGLFGTAVDIAGDTIVVTAPGEDFGAGAAYVFVRNGAQWTQEAYLAVSSPFNSDRFGEAVAISATAQRLIVGAPDRPFGGIAYIFVRDQATWSEEASFQASNAGSVDGFGSSVAISGNTAVVGAPGEDGLSTGVDGDPSNQGQAVDTGAAYVFVRDGASWAQRTYIKASNTGVGDHFAECLSLSGDRLAIGTPDEDSAGQQANNGAHNSGAVYFFGRCGETWTQDAYLKASNIRPVAAFGVVALEGDRLVVGALMDNSDSTGVNGSQTNNNAVNSGAAYAFVIPPAASGSFCTSLPNATGMAAVLSCSGQPGSSLVLTSTPVPNSTGQFFFGPMMLAGNPFGDGLLCVGGTTRRMSPLVSAGMMMQLPNTASITIDYGAPYAPGLTGTQYFQHWFRSGLATGSGFNTSNALSVTF